MLSIIVIGLDSLVYIPAYGFRMQQIDKVAHGHVEIFIHPSVNELNEENTPFLLVADTANARRINGDQLHGPTCVFIPSTGECGCKWG
jgi:hypothetical protein